MIEVNFSVGQKGPGGTRFGKLLVGLKELQILNTERPLAMRHLDSFLKSFLAWKWWWKNDDEKMVQGHEEGCQCLSSAKVGAIAGY
jgi:hypothetical protein